MSTETIAPAWAKWLAMDKDGTWFWYEKKPFRQRNCNSFYSQSGRQKIVWPDQPEEVADWTKSLKKLETVTHEL
jgi:hypothetical protein